jgi:hypothetical protein
VVALPQLPNTSDTTPFALVIAEEVSAAIAVHADTTVVVGPTPLRATVQAVIIVVFPVQLPVFADNLPASTSPLLEDAKPVKMTADASGVAPEPARSFVVVVVLPLVPIRAHAAPFALVILVQGA